MNRSQSRCKTGPAGLSLGQGKLGEGNHGQAQDRPGRQAGAPPGRLPAWGSRPAQFFPASQTQRSCRRPWKACRWTKPLGLVVRQPQAGGQAQPPWEAAHANSSRPVQATASDPREGHAGASHAWWPEFVGARQQRPSGRGENHLNGLIKRGKTRRVCPDTGRKDVPGPHTSIAAGLMRFC